MPIKYVGKTIDHCGKTLWEIVGNLRNFGVGRLVKRNMFDRYPEPCFFRIVKVEAVEIEPNVDRRVRVWAHKIFRGRSYPNLIELHRVSYKSDYRLVHKSEEKALWEKINEVSHKEKILPSTIPFPPVMAEIIKEEMLLKGKPVVEPRLPLNIRQGRENFYRVAGEHELPNVELSDRPQFDLR